MPERRTPTESDWASLAKTFASDIDARIEGLTQLRTKLDGCIGCGCLSLQRCQLYNLQDSAAQLGTGPSYLLGDRPGRPDAEPPEVRGGL